ncbi:hypothetical protein MtrunA17_Chr1g0191651 [Medicago truncatula]|uniref:Uncharacterized protein n=1 Tax=Medicago truncatula TaxID=3880 RepID=A0A396JVD0_MEDTR|nr:hypothetical protein MtrunA17_Chr1g0191651 [Medicago truncatula]
MEDKGKPRTFPNISHLNLSHVITCKTLKCIHSIILNVCLELFQGYGKMHLHED